MPDELPPLEYGSDQEGFEGAVMRSKESQCSDKDDDDGSEDSWNEMDQESEPTRCLFCDAVPDSIEAAISHLVTTHNFDLNVIKDKFNMDQYSYIKVSFFGLS